MDDMAAAMVKQFRQVARQIGLIQSSGSNARGSESATSPPADRGASSGEIQIEVVQPTVTMASIVEKETAVPDERPLVAGVYFNRLEKKIALDADPSIIYAELLAGTYQGALHHADMRFNSPYNTYKNVGLPPGPIGNPGEASLRAALAPAQTDYLYFVANTQGGHFFAGTLVEHNRNVNRYHRLLAGLPADAPEPDPDPAPAPAPPKAAPTARAANTTIRDNMASPGGVSIVSPNERI